MPKKATVMPETVRLGEETYNLLHDACERTGESNQWIANRILLDSLKNWPDWLRALERPGPQPVPMNRYRIVEA